jgi:polysaccharide biosynthesis protein VpsQ
MKIIWITGIYILLLTSIVYLAAHHQYHDLFSIIRNLPGGDKYGHFLLMGLLSFLINTSLRCRKLDVRAKRVLLGSGIVSLAVTLEEVSQIFMQYRSFDLVDLLFDYLGIWVFGKVALYVRARRLIPSN